MMSNAFDSSATWSYVTFPVVPKRSPKVQFNLYTPKTSTLPSPLSLVGRVTFPNPVLGRFAQWKPEALPAVKTTDDLEVRLETVSIGHAARGTVERKPWGFVFGPDGPLTRFGFSLRSAKGASEQWVLHATELSDATGNQLRCLSENMVYWLRGDLKYPNATGWAGYGESLPGMPWPDEAAWRLKLELKRVRGFDPLEMVTIKNIPVPKAGTTNSLFLTNTAGNVQIILEWPQADRSLGNKRLNLTSWPRE